MIEYLKEIHIYAYKNNLQIQEKKFVSLPSHLPYGESWQPCSILQYRVPNKMRDLFHTSFSLLSSKEMKRQTKHTMYFPDALLNT